MKNRFVAFVILLIGCNSPDSNKEADEYYNQFLNSKSRGDDFDAKSNADKIIIYSHNQKQIDEAKLWVSEHRSYVDSINEVRDKLIKEIQEQAKEELSYPNDPYEVMHSTFDGSPEKKEIQPILEYIMRRHNYPVNRGNLTKIANLLFVLKQKSLVGVTEMEILKHMYQRGSSSNTIDKQAGISAAILEQTK